MYLHYRDADGSDGIQQGNRRVRITTGIEHYPHGTALFGAVKGIDQLALMVALIVRDGSIGIKVSQIFERGLCGQIAPLRPQTGAGEGGGRSLDRKSVV